MTIRKTKFRRKTNYALDFFGDKQALMTYKEIGEKLGIDERQVRYIERSALKKLAAYFGGPEKIREYLS